MDATLAKTTRRILLALAGVVTVFAIAGLAVILLAYPFDKPVPYLLGLLVGGGLSAVKMILLNRSLSRSVDMERDHAKNSANLQFVLRYFLTLAVLAATIFLREFISPIGAILGLLSLQLSAYVTGFLERRDEKARFAIHGYPPPLEDDEDEDEEEKSIWDALKK